MHIRMILYSFTTMNSTQLCNNHDCKIWFFKAIFSFSFKWYLCIVCRQDDDYDVQIVVQTVNYKQPCLKEKSDFYLTISLPIIYKGFFLIFINIQVDNNNMYEEINEKFKKS